MDSLKKKEAFKTLFGSITPSTKESSPLVGRLLTLTELNEVAGAAHSQIGGGDFNQGSGCSYGQAGSGSYIQVCC